MTNALVEGDYYPEYTGPTQDQYVPNTAEYQPPIFCYKCKTEVDNTTLAAYKNAADIECAAIAELKRVLDVKYAAKENCADYEICAADITQTPDGHFEFERSCKQVDETKLRMGCTRREDVPDRVGKYAR
ncbi:hypothetical protein RvY_08401 [Ramazzottius varieornatus]|uniref:Uncharacterized protein n=1 Tax=Ramazzottius varieornatus TaxID=947166 RepID=A0A1D1VEV6_RAMVA|nr:hypothetical protein RvY_08401 [Ramazzottius varieornatus]